MRPSPGVDDDLGKGEFMGPTFFVGFGFGLCHLIASGTESNFRNTRRLRVTR